MAQKPDGGGVIDLTLNQLVLRLLAYVFIAAVHGVLSYLRFLQHEALRWRQPPPAVVYAAMAVAGAFTVLRNLPHHAF